MSSRYAAQIFSNACRSLDAESLGGERERLIAAAHELTNLLERDMPTDFSAEIKNLLESLTSWSPVQQEGFIAATVNLISGEEVHRLSAWIRDLSSRIRAER